MIKIYGMPSCPDCAVLKPQIEGNPNYEFIDIGENVRNLHAFLDLRDNEPEFASCAKEGRIGIPCFILDDGRITLVQEEAGLSSSPVKASCSITGEGC